MLIRDAGLLVKKMGEEIPGGWVAIEGTRVAAVGGPGDEPPAADRTISAGGGLVTPGLINAHHHLYQNLTRAFAPAVNRPLFSWLETLYPVWARLDEEAAYVSAWIGLAELALGGCTTTTDHLYVHPRPGLIEAEIAAAREVGLRFHPTRGSMSRSRKDGGLPPDSVVQTADEILADSERLVAAFHDPSPGAMVRIGLAPCSPFTVTAEEMRATAELAERLDVRLHTHIAEDPGETGYCLEQYSCRPVELLKQVGWGSERTWVAHCIHPNDDEIAALGRWGTGVAHCPSSNLLLGAGLAPVHDLRAAGAPVGLGCDGSASTDSANLWLEARTALLLGHLRHGAASMTARDALEIATTGSAACLGRAGELGTIEPGKPADIVVWPADPILLAGAHSDPVEAWLRCGPFSARWTIVNGRVIVEDGALAVPGVEEQLRDHARIAREWQFSAARGSACG